MALRHREAQRGAAKAAQGDAALCKDDMAKAGQSAVALGKGEARLRKVGQWQNKVMYYMAKARLRKVVHWRYKA